MYKRWVKSLTSRRKLIDQGGRQNEHHQSNSTCHCPPHRLGRKGRGRGRGQVEAGRGCVCRTEGPGEGGLVARVPLREELAQPAARGKVTRAA